MVPAFKAETGSQGRWRHSGISVKWLKLALTSYCTLSLLLSHEWDVRHGDLRKAPISLAEHESQERKPRVTVPSKLPAHTLLTYHAGCDVSLMLPCRDLPSSFPLFPSLLVSASLCPLLSHRSLTLCSALKQPQQKVQVGA